MDKEMCDPRVLTVTEAGPGGGAKGAMAPPEIFDK